MTGIMVEERILGAMLDNHASAVKIVQRVKAEWFQKEDNRAAFEAFRAHMVSGGQLSLLNAARLLKGNKAVPNATLLVSDAQANAPVGYGSIVDSAIDDLLYNATVANVQQASASLASIAHSEATATEMRSKALEAALTIIGRDETDVREFKQPTGDELWEAAYTADDTASIPFPFAEMNESRGGYAPGEIVVVSGYTGHGKSWMALQYLEAAVKAGKRVYYASLEMTFTQLQNRLLAMGGHDLSKLEAKQIPLSSLASRREELRSYSYAVAEGALHVHDYVSAKRMADLREQPYDVMIVDHVHLMQVGGKDYRLALNEAMSRLKAFATQEHVALVLLAQLNRPNRGNDTSSAPKRPTLSSLRESTAIEQIADYVTFIYRNYDEDGVMTDSGVYYTEKQRQGRTHPAIDVRFHKTRNQFVPQVVTESGESFDAGMVA